MRYLVLTLTLLFFTGTHGRFLWPQDEPNPLDHYVQKALNAALVVGSAALKTVKETELGKQLNSKLKEKFEDVKINALSLKKEIDSHLDMVLKRLEKDLDEKYPMVKQKVTPILAQFIEQWDKQVRSFRKDLNRVGIELLSGIRSQLNTFLYKLQPIAEDARDNMRSEVNVLRTNLAPYVEEIQKKIEQELKDDVEPKAKELRDNLYKHTEELGERLKPYAEKLKEQLIPHAEEVQTQLDKVLEIIKESFGKKD